MEKKKVIFMGTPEFAATILQKLVENEINVIAVVTMPDKPAGRGQKLSTSAVKDYALTQNLPLLQPEKLKDNFFIEQLQNYNADLFVVVAFRMLPEIVWAMPKLGTINLHASLLPQYRGAAPINWAIINGETQTGVSTFFIEKEIDTGKIIDSATINIGTNWSAGELHDELMNLGASLTLKTVKAVFSNNYEAQSQNDVPELELKSAPKLFKSDCAIDWNNTSEKIHNKIRGLSPYPTAWTNLITEQGSKTVKLFRTSLTEKKNSAKVGIITIENFDLFVSTLDGLLKIEELQLEGKKRMDARSFCLGTNLKNTYFQS